MDNALTDKQGIADWLFSTAEGHMALAHAIAFLMGCIVGKGLFG